jgi:hypothetical protein
LQLPLLDPTLFNSFTWMAGNPMTTFNIPCIFSELTNPESKRIFRKYAIGYCNAENLICRPKIDNKAVMFCKDGENSWFHLTNKEFEEIFLKE